MRDLALADLGDIAALTLARDEGENVLAGGEGGFGQCLCTTKAADIVPLFDRLAATNPSHVHLEHFFPTFGFEPTVKLKLDFI